MLVLVLASVVWARAGGVVTRHVLHTTEFCKLADI